MPVRVEGEDYYTNSEVSEELGVSRQTLWRWREKGSIPAGLRYRTRQVLFKRTEVDAIRQFANRLEPIELGGGGGVRQLALFRSGSRLEES
jgi:excisionase family DNA binding protein